MSDLHIAFLHLNALNGTSTNRLASAGDTPTNTAFIIVMLKGTPSPNTSCQSQRLNIINKQGANTNKHNCSVSYNNQ